MHFSIDRTVHTTAFDKPVVDHWLERKIAQTAGYRSGMFPSPSLPLLSSPCLLLRGKKDLLHRGKKDLLLRGKKEVDIM